MCLMKIMNEPYDSEDGTIRLRQIATSECITSGAPSDDPFLKLGSYPLATRRTIDGSQTLTHG